MSRYLITHDRCNCREQASVHLRTSYAVALWLWGRNVLDHIVYEGECPYRFTVGDMDTIEATLRLYPVALVRHVLPLRITVGTLRRHGITTSRVCGASLACCIGDEP